MYGFFNTRELALSTRTAFSCVPDVAECVNIHLELWLRAARADDDARTIGGGVADAVGGGQAFARLVQVGGLGDGCPGQRPERMLVQLGP